MCFFNLLDIDGVEYNKIMIFMSVIFNIIGIFLTVTTRIKCKKFKIDAGTFSDPDSGFIELEMGCAHKVGMAFLYIGTAMQLYQIVVVQ